MKIKVIQPLSVACTDGAVRYCRPGEVVSVYHTNGRRLLYARLAQWISRDTFDPAWDVPEFMKAAKPQHDKMLRSATNKGAA